MLSSEINTIASNSSFQLLTKDMSPVTNKPVLHTGSAIMINIWPTVAPSIHADSISSFGILLKNPVIIYMVRGREKVRYGNTRPVRVLDNPIFANLVNKGIITQCTGIIIPIRKYVSAAPENFQRNLPIAKAAIEPIIRLRISVTVHTINELSVAVPSLPAVHAKVKFSRLKLSGIPKGFVKISLLVLNDTRNTQKSGARYSIAINTRKI